MLSFLFFFDIKNCLEVLGVFDGKEILMIGECGVFAADNKGQSRRARSRKTVVITAKQPSIKTPLVWKVHPITSNAKRRVMF